MPPPGFEPESPARKARMIGRTTPSEEYKEIPERRSEIEAGHLSTVFNKYKKKEFEDYNIKDSYYLEECYKVTIIIKKNPYT